MPQIDLDIASQGLTDGFIEQVQTRILARVLPAAETYYAAGGTAYTQNPPSMAREEMAVRYFDRQACAISLLGRLGSEGNRQADMLARHLFDNAAYYLAVWRSRERHTAPLARSLLHLTLCYDALKHQIDPGMARRWRATALRAADDVLNQFKDFEQEPFALDSDEIAGAAVTAEGVWQVCRIFGRNDWKVCAETFVDALVQHAQTDDVHEGEEGPALRNSNRAMGCGYLVHKWREQDGPDPFERFGTHYRNYLLAGLTSGSQTPSPDTDRRSMDAYGVARHSRSAEGRGILRLVLEPDNGILESEDTGLDFLARLSFELNHCERGEGTVPKV